MIRVLGLVPARGGSKGIPRKNVRLLAGKPLLQYTAEAALQATRLSRVILSTEDEEIAAVGRRCGLEVPFLRPMELALDDTPSLAVVQHAVRWTEMIGESFDAVCLLEPTSPLRRAEHIDACIELLERRGADTVISVIRVPVECHPDWAFVTQANGCLRLFSGAAQPIPRRQELVPAFHREGSVYVTRCAVLLTSQGLYGDCVVGYEMDPEETVNINGLADWERAERLLGARMAHVS